MNSLPVGYDYISQYNAQINPSTTHTTNNYQAIFYRRYLIQELFSLFDFKIPETWDIDYFRYSLFLWGFIVIFDSEEYGVIPQQCGITGYDLFYRPKFATVCNPQLRKNYYNLELNKNAVLVKVSPDYGGLWDIISHYADLMSINIQALAMNMNNSKLAYVFGAENKNMAESLKKMFDEIMAGNPAVFVDKALYNKNTGDLSLQLFNRDLRNTYIANDILETMRKIKVMFFNDIGVPNANTEKKERLITDEVNANNIETQTKFSLWLDEIKRGFEKANKMFNLDLSVKPSFERSETCVNKSPDAI